MSKAKCAKFTNLMRNGNRIGVDIAFHSLINGDVLFNQSRNFIGLLGLDSGDPLLHQVATLHVQEQGTVVRLHFARRDDFSEWVME